jgi:hypothetical protein
MSDLFSHPIVVTVLDAHGFKNTLVRKIKTQIVWSNDAPKNIKKALQDGDTITLKKFYKVDPFSLPDIPKLTNNYKKIGGDAFSFEEIDSIKLDEVDDIVDKEIVQLDKGFSEPVRITFSHPIIVQNDHYVFPDDNLELFKRKIQVTTGIPVYRQHLWYEYKEEVYSPCYELHKDNIIENINIWKLQNDKTYINEIPVNVNWYAKRNNIRVFNKERQTLISHIYKKHPNATWFVIDINDTINDRKQLSIHIEADIYVRELIYYSYIIKYWPSITSNVFNNFIKNEKQLRLEYPNMVIKSKYIKCVVDLETKLLKNNYLPSLTEIKNTIFLTTSRIDIINTHFSYGSSINLRNLFNEIITNNNLVFVTCNTDINGKQYNLVKKSTFGLNYKINTSASSMIIVVIIPDIGELFINIFADGKLHVNSVWREDKHITIEDVYTYVILHTNIIIKLINDMGENISMRKLILMNQNNIILSNVGVSFIINMNLSIFQFDELKNITNKYAEADILRVSSSDINLISFYLLKGMHRYDDTRFKVISNINNEYEVNTILNIKQKWESVYLRQKSCVIKNRTADILINVICLHIDEISAFVQYILQIVQMTNVDNKSMVIQRERSVSYLKEMDPILYDLKGIYKSKKMYSQICQKPNQPIAINKPSKNSVKYWNFTTNEPQYYECPNIKFPVIYFKTGVHPKNYCIPCCKKMELSDNSKHGNIFNTCINTHVFDDNSKNVTKSTYIVSYGKFLNDHRLSKLPESSLDQLFYQQHSINGKPMDIECLNSKGYYLYGIPQVIGKIQNVGFLSTLSFILEKNVYDIIDEIAIIITKSKNKWNLLLEGSINMHFKNMKIFVETMKSAFIGGDEQISFDLWNEVFIDIALIYWNIKVIQFVDNGTTLILSIPNGVNDVKEYFVKQNKYILVVKKNNIINPIFLVDIQKYKLTGDVDSKLFTVKDKIITSIGMMISRSIKTIEKNTPPTLSIVLDFIYSSDDKYSIECILINKKNTCYAVLLNDNNGLKNIYFPIEDSLHDHVIIKKSIDIYDHDSYNTERNCLMSFVTDYNVWATKMDYSKILISSWILLNNKIIGWKDQFEIYIYYITPISIAEAQKFKDIPIVKHLYSTTVINRIIEEWAPPVIDKKELAKNIYSHYLYQLFVLEFTSYINRVINVKMRNKVKNYIILYEKDNIKAVASLRELLKEFPDDYSVILNILSRYTVSKENTTIYEKLIGYKHTNFSYTAVINIITYSRFVFDDIETQHLFSMEEAELKENVEKIMLSIVEVRDEDPDIDTISNSFISCFSKNQNNNYCANNKLIIEKSKYDQFLLFLINDIQNPIKRRVLLNPIVKTSINDFKFKINPYENIYINTT